MNERYEQLPCTSKQEVSSSFPCLNGSHEPSLITTLDGQITFTLHNRDIQEPAGPLPTVADQPLFHHPQDIKVEPAEVKEEPIEYEEESTQEGEEPLADVSGYMGEAQLYQLVSSQSLSALLVCYVT